MSIPKPERRGYRLVTDYTAVTSRTERSPFPTPNMKAMMAAITGGGCFAKLDLFKGYWQFPLSGPGQEIHTLVTGESLYSRIRVPQGVLNATTHIQEQMTAVLEGLLTKICLLWVDDLLSGEQMLKTSSTVWMQFWDSWKNVAFLLEETRLCCMPLKSNGVARFSLVALFDMT
ncbi:unnamed protein product [Discosporangium mesarthrocarpum]